MYYILQNGKVKPIDDVLEWAKAFKTTDRSVDFTRLDDGVEVSTVFLSLDHNHSGVGPPILFETMVFGGEHNFRMIRSSTYGQAHRIHWKVVEALKIGEEIVWDRDFLREFLESILGESEGE
jgi:hypothetical protein